MRPALLALAVLLAGCAAPVAVGPDPEAPLAAPPSVRILPTGHDGAEPSLGIASDGTLFVTSWDKVLRSRDGGATWDVVRHLFPEDDDLLGALRKGGALKVEDPMLWLDPATDRVFAAPMFPILLCKHLAWSDDGGDTWTERPGECHPPPYDHQKVMSAPPGPRAPATAGVAYPSVLFDCWHAVFSQQCAVSWDGGLTWPVHSVVADAARGEHARDSADACTQNGRPAAAPDGVVALPLSKACPFPTVAFSDDSGLTWTVTQAPVEGGTEDDDHAAAFDADGVLHLAYPDAAHVLHLVRTPDRGATWEGPFRVAAPDVGTTLFQALVADGRGRLAAAYLGTDEAAGSPEKVSDEARWHLHLATSDDGGRTWTTTRATPEGDPVHIGRYCMQGVECLGASRHLADFIDARRAPDGDFVVAYADACVDGCATSDDSRRAVTTLARLDAWSP